MDLQQGGVIGTLFTLHNFCCCIIAYGLTISDKCFLVTKTLPDLACTMLASSSNLCKYFYSVSSETSNALMTVPLTTRYSRMHVTRSYDGCSQSGSRVSDAPIVCSNQNRSRFSSGWNLSAPSFRGRIERLRNQRMYSGCQCRSVAIGLLISQLGE